MLPHRAGPTPIYRSPRRLPAINLLGMTVSGFISETTSEPRVLTMTNGTESGVFGYGLAVTWAQFPSGLGASILLLGIVSVYVLVLRSFYRCVADLCHATIL